LIKIYRETSMSRTLVGWGLLQWRFALLGVFFLGSGLAAGDTTTPGTEVHSLDREIERGDSLWMDGKYQQALFKYLSLLPGNEKKILWRLARVYCDLGDSKPRDQRESTYDRALEYARRSVKKAPSLSESHTVLAVALGKKAIFAGGKRQIELSREIRDEAIRAIELNRKNYIAHIILGIWNRELANLGFFERTGAELFYGGLPDASNDRAVYFFKRAIELHHRSLTARLELGRTYLNMGEEEKARRMFQEVLKIPIKLARDKKVKAAARKALADL